jgi:hypothetical protein
MSEDEASNMIQFISVRRELWSKLFELRNWVQFLNAIVKAVETSKSEVEEILDEAIKKLEGIE